MTVAGRSVFQLLIPAGLSLQLSACAIKDPPSQQLIVNEALPPGTSVPSRWVARNANRAAVTQGWVTTFHDPILSALVAEANANNPDLAATAARVDAAREALVIAGAPLFPAISLDATGKRTRDLDAGETLKHRGGRLNILWEVDVWGRIRSSQAASVAGYEAAAEDEEFARLSLAALVARSWYVNSELIQRIALARQEIRIYSELLKLVREKRKAGQVDLIDVYQAEASVNAAQAGLVQAQEKSSTAIRSLEILLGRYPGHELKARNSYVTPPPTVPAGLPASLLSRRPDVLASERLVAAAFYNVQVAKLSLLPAISLTGAGGRLVDPGLSLLGFTPDYLQLGANLLQPIFQGGALQAQIKVASAEQRVAVASYGQSILLAFKEVETSLANEEYLRRRLDYLNAELNDRTQTVRIAYEKYRAGNIDLQSFLQFQEKQVAVQEEVIVAQGAILTNRIDLHLALGGSF